ncbi:MAG: hypothetical protein R2712_07015 [Vicinamibacterales bacterium]
MNAARSVVASAHALLPAGLAVPEDDTVAPVDVDELRARADTALARLGEVHARLEEARADGGAAALDRALAEANKFGVRLAGDDGGVDPDGVVAGVGGRLSKAVAVDVGIHRA